MVFLPVDFLPRKVKDICYFLLNCPATHRNERSGGGEIIFDQLCLGWASQRRLVGLLKIQVGEVWPFIFLP